MSWLGEEASGGEIVYVSAGSILIGSSVPIPVSFRKGNV